MRSWPDTIDGSNYECAYIIGENPLILDLRNPKEYNEGHIHMAVNITNFKKFTNDEKDSMLKNPELIDLFIQNSTFQKRGTFYYRCILYGDEESCLQLKEILENEKKLEKILYVSGVEMLFATCFDNMSWNNEPEIQNPVFRVFKNNLMRIQQEPKRIEFKISDQTGGFIIENLFSRLECDYYIDLLEKIDYQDLSQEYPKEYRNNQRRIIFSKEWSGILTKRLFPFFKKQDIKGISPIGFGSEGIWKPHRINECFKFSKYSQEEKFNYHRDGIYCPTEDECSIFTVLIYLNENFKGGETVFKDTKEFIEPKMGYVLVFPGHVHHKGNEVSEGVKYIVKTEVICKRVNSNQIPKSIKESYLQNEEYKKAKNLFNESESYENTGKVELFTKTFNDALEILVENSLKRVEQDSKFNHDVLTLIFEYLTKRELISMMTVSKSWNLASIEDHLWHHFYLKDFYSMKKTVSISEHWYNLYKQRYFIENHFRTVVFELNDLHLNFGVVDAHHFSSRKKWNYPSEKKEYNIYDSSYLGMDALKTHTIDSCVAKKIENNCLWYMVRNIDRYEAGNRIFKLDTVAECQYISCNGNIKNLNYFIQLLVAGYYDLNIDSSCHPVLFVEPPLGWDNDMKSQLKEKMFQMFNVCSVSFMNAIDLLIQFYELKTCILLFIRRGNQFIVNIVNGVVSDKIDINTKEVNEMDKLREDFEFPSIDLIKKELFSFNKVENIYVSIGAAEKDSEMDVDGFHKKLEQELSTKVHYLSNNGELDALLSGMNFATTNEYSATCEFNF
jgi:hypothetical protein